jgi:glycosidase
MYFTGKFENEREYDDYMENGEIPHLRYLYSDIQMKSTHEVGFRKDDNGNYYGLRTGRLISTQEQRDQVVHKDYATQRIDTLRAKIKSEKAAMAKLENAAEDKTDQIIAYARHLNGKTLLVVANKNVNRPISGIIKVPTLKSNQELKNLLPSYGKKSLIQAKDGELAVELGPARVHVFEIDTPNIENYTSKIYKQNL